jgi:hypothetical protein
VPGIRDKSTFGHPGRYTSCIAENEEASPWPPHHVDNGYSIDSNTVSLFPVFPPMEIYNQSDHQPEQVLESLCHIMAADANCEGEVLLILSPQHAKTIAATGWSKDQVRDYMVGRIAELYPKLSLQPMQSDPGADAPDPAAAEEPAQEGERPWANVGYLGPIQSEGITILVAGGEGGGHSSILPSWGFANADARWVIEPAQEGEKPWANVGYLGPIQSEGITILVAGGEGGGHSSILPSWGFANADARWVIEPVVV